MNHIRYEKLNGPIYWFLAVIHTSDDFSNRMEIREFGHNALDSKIVVDIKGTSHIDDFPLKIEEAWSEASPFAGGQIIQIRRRDIPGF
jgi:hypothetical protein